MSELDDNLDLIQTDAGAKEAVIASAEVRLETAADNIIRKGDAVNEICHDLVALNNGPQTDLIISYLSKKYKVLKTKEHQNSEIGVAKCILNDLKSEHEIFIAEVGAYNKGKVKEVCSILRPEIGIVTGINEQHLALFGSMENLLSAEA